MCVCVCVCHVCLLYFEAFNYNTISKIKSPIISVNTYTFPSIVSLLIHFPQYFRLKCYKSI